MITIKINETNNQLKIKEDYDAIICGNTNYQLEFEFGDDWQNITKKIALLVLEGKKTAIEFEGSTLSLPALPNAQTMNLVLMSAESESSRLVTSPLEIDLAPTTLAENLPEFKPLTAYVNEVLAKIEALMTGSQTIASSKNAETANFAKNVSNPNLLINGDFKVNQRGGTTYTEAGKYTVDRWKLVSGSVEVVTGGIILNGTIIQKLEHTPTMQVVASSNAGTISYSNGAVTLSTTTATLITYAKLEVGTTATPFSPRSYAEELAMCQRYYQVIKKLNGNTNLNLALVRNETNIRIFINLTQSLRTSPTISNSNCVLFNVLNDTVIVATDNCFTVTCLSSNQCVLNFVTTDLTRGLIYFVSDTNGLAKIELDAEIY